MGFGFFRVVAVGLGFGMGFRLGNWVLDFWTLSPGKGGLRDLRAGQQQHLLERCLGVFCGFSGLRVWGLRGLGPSRFRV